MAAAASNPGLPTRKRIRSPVDQAGDAVDQAVDVPLSDEKQFTLRANASSLNPWHFSNHLHTAGSLRHRSVCAGLLRESKFARKIFHYMPSQTTSLVDWHHQLGRRVPLTWSTGATSLVDCFSSQLLFAVRYKTLSVNRRTWRWNEVNTRLCLQCNRGTEETVEHLVLECSKYEHERESFMYVIHEQYGENQCNPRCVEEDSGMRCLVELDEECNMTVVDAMKNFLTHAWNKRH
ncbi:hypothetical protein FHG87_015275 [Trinorchestia longiramus]|nr:hypothetical protein FHG87_015275 [Trinorchestia longiramus]